MYPSIMVKMRAVVYKGPFEVEVSEVEKPSILHPSDVIVKVCSFPKYLTYSLNPLSFFQSQRLASAEGESSSGRRHFLFIVYQ